MFFVVVLLIFLLFLVHSLLIQRLGIVHIEDAQSERKSASSWWNISLYVSLLSTCVNLVLPVPTVIHAHIMSILSPSFNDQVWTFIRHPTITQPGRQHDIQHLDFELGNFLDVNWTSMKCAGNLND